MWMDWLGGGPGPKRGDLVHSNVGDRRERTWFILRARRITRYHKKNCMALREFTNGNYADALSFCNCGWTIPRFELWMARWWELEPEIRTRLHRSAERNGGQQVIYMERYPAKKRKTKEQDFFSRG